MGGMNPALLDRYKYPNVRSISWSYYQKEGVTMKHWLITVLSLAVLLGDPGKDPSPCQVVEAIEIQSGSQRWEFRDSEALSAILNYLRFARAQEAVQAPETGKIRYLIQVLDSGGHRERYALWDWVYFQDKNGQWQRIDPEWGQCLPLLLEILSSSDSEAAPGSGLPGQ